MNHDPKKILSGIGFYAVLLLCLTAVGTASYFLLFRGGSVQPDPASSAEESFVTTAQDVRERVTAAIADIALPQETEETPVYMPEKAVTDEPVAQLPVMDNTPVAAEAPSLVVSPLEGDVVSAFSVDQLQYDETLGDWRTHAGIDIAAAEGSSVLAASAGTVFSVSDDALMGTTVVLRHSGGYETTYANLRPDLAVEQGDTVSAGQVIGTVGSSSIAESAEGAHLHFSVTQDGDAVNPEAYLGK